MWEDKWKRLTVLFPKFFTLQLRYAVFPSSAVTFLEDALSTYGPVLTAFPSSATGLLFAVVPEFCVLGEAVVGGSVVVIIVVSVGVLLAPPPNPFALFPPPFLPVLGICAAFTSARNKKERKN